MRYTRLAMVLAIVLSVGLVLPEHEIMPVEGSSRSDWNPDSFWYEPWGESGVHKGIDIFANAGTPVLATVGGIVLFSGERGRGGNVVLVLGPRWKLYYYAHLQSLAVQPLSLVAGGAPLGSVGSSGNARGKSPHLHFSIVSLLPHFWHFSTGPQGWKKIFYLDPNDALGGL